VLVEERTDPSSLSPPKLLPAACAGAKPTRMLAALGLKLLRSVADDELSHLQAAAARRSALPTMHAVAPAMTVIGIW